MGSDEPDLGNQYVDTSGAKHWARYVVQQWFQIWDLSKKFREMPLKEYLNLRDDPYKENKGKLDSILSRQSTKHV